MAHDFLSQILILLAGSLLVLSLVRRFKLPPILGYLLVGMVLGPHALGLVPSTTSVQVLAEIGVVFLVFTLGLEFSLARMVAMKSEVLGIGGLQVLLCSLAFGGMAFAYGSKRGRRHRHRRRARDVVDGDRAAATGRPDGAHAHARATRAGHPAVPGPRLRATARAGHRPQHVGRCPRAPVAARHGGTRPVRARRRAGRGALAAAPALSRDRAPSQHGNLHPDGPVRVPAGRVGNGPDGPVDGARRIPRRHAARRDRVQAPDRSRHQAVPGHPARPVLRVRRHVAGPAPAAHAAAARAAADRSAPARPRR